MFQNVAYWPNVHKTGALFHLYQLFSWSATAYLPYGMTELEEKSWMVENEEFFKKFRALIILFLLSTPWRKKKKTKKAFQSYAVSRTSEAKSTLQIYTAGIWDTGKNCTLDKYLVYAVQWKSCWRWGLLYNDDRSIGEWQQGQKDRVRKIEKVLYAMMACSSPVESMLLGKL